MNRRSLIKMLSGISILPLLPGATLAATAQRRVILLELSGANDGLNTVVPFKDDRYHELRPNIALKQTSIISLDDYFGFNNALEELMPLWEHGEMAVAQGLGYPNPNRSHFKSIALWETGGDGNHKLHDGWITHDIEHSNPVANVDAHGISLGGSMGVFVSPSGNWLSMATASQFSGRSIELPSETGCQRNDKLRALLENAAILDATLDRIAKKVEANPHHVRVRIANGFDSQVGHVINLINSGVDTPVIKISLSGFDTHENQIGRHSKLLKQLAVGISRLRNELNKTDNWNNTAVITYSEFGRRAAQNRSYGTDHGTAAAHFVFGGKVSGGFHGKHPELGNLVNGDLQFTMDYRALYSSVLSDWFKVENNVFSQYHDNKLGKLFI